MHHHRLHGMGGLWHEASAWRPELPVPHTFTGPPSLTCQRFSLLLTQAGGAISMRGGYAAVAETIVSECEGDLVSACPPCGPHFAPLAS